MRNLMREYDLVNSGRLAATSRWTRDATRMQRAGQVARTLTTRSPTADYRDDLRWALRTPGAGNTSRHLLRRHPAADDDEQVQRRARHPQVDPNAVMYDVSPYLADPGLIRPLLELSPDTTWLAPMLERAVSELNLPAVNMLVNDMPWRAPSIRPTANVLYPMSITLKRLLADRDTRAKVGPQVTRAVIRLLPMVLQRLTVFESTHDLLPIGAMLAMWLDPEETVATCEEFPLALDSLLVGVARTLVMAREVDRVGLWAPLMPMESILDVVYLMLGTFTRRVIASGLLDRAFAAGHVSVTLSHVALHRSRGSPVTKFSREHPDIDAWAAALP